MESKSSRTHPVNAAEPRNFALVQGCDDTVGPCCRGGICGLVCVVVVLMCGPWRSFLQLLPSRAEQHVMLENP